MLFHHLLTYSLPHLTIPKINSPRTLLFLNSNHLIYSQNSRKNPNHPSKSYYSIISNSHDPISNVPIPYYLLNEKNSTSYVQHLSHPQNLHLYSPKHSSNHPKPNPSHSQSYSKHSFSLTNHSNFAFL
jgi:hypothetical protein